MCANVIPRRRTQLQRLLFAIPMLGIMFCDAEDVTTRDWAYSAVGLFLLWGVLILLFGLPGLYMPAVAMVPVMFLILLRISRG
ncbi:hypothetical protein RUM8411_01208 [Ruegeria meonggei]|uniref:Uncharacterized protein n=2 Tax=Ruegeria meonggei TaxID=1446476 RepID=A0A1X6YSL4_9RHOB|nr:hypothetical protein RUM8411_01208 [Ruegeria meonggei]